MLVTRVQQPDAWEVPPLLHPLFSLAFVVPDRSITVHQQLQVMVLALLLFADLSINYRLSLPSSFLDHTISSRKSNKVRTNNR